MNTVTVNSTECTQLYIGTRCGVVVKLPAVPSMRRGIESQHLGWFKNTAHSGVLHEEASPPGIEPVYTGGHGVEIIY
jgi:hypothetical protein